MAVGGEQPHQRLGILLLSSLHQVKSYQAAVAHFGLRELRVKLTWHQTCNCTTTLCSAIRHRRGLHLCNGVQPAGAIIAKDLLQQQ